MRDDAVLPATRALSIFIVPFLVVAFVVLYGFPSDTDRLFAWTIKPPMTPMTLGAVYLGGALFFVRAARATEWHTVKMGFVAVGTFASAMGVATVLHWDRFNHDHVAFWLWAGLYFTTPFLVWGAWAANRRREAPAPAAAGELELPGSARLVIAVTAGAAVLAGAYLFLFPTEAARGWPWAVTPLTARVLGAILFLGTAGFGVLTDARWSSARVMVQIQLVMMSLILLAAARAPGDFDGSKPMAWLLLGGFVSAIAGGAGLTLAMSSRAGGRRTGKATKGAIP